MTQTILFKGMHAFDFFSKKGQKFKANLLYSLKVNLTHSSLPADVRPLLHADTVNSEES